MRLSRYYIPTLKEDPADAEVVSHKLLMRAGMIRKLTSGIYNYLPLGLRSINKVGQIVREEMNRAGALEVLLPTVQPADLWKETGRWEYYGKELLRFKDRHDRDYCLGPTHEEVITDLVRGEIKSYKQLPVNLYQIRTKFRDEIRPRFGLMRGREFIMKDAYSFDKDEAGAEKSYFDMFNAYKAAFSRIGLRFKPVQADSGAIGGDFSHEFMVLAETGEDTIASCLSCDFGANLEKAKVAAPATGPADESTVPSLEEVATPGAPHRGRGLQLPRHFRRQAGQDPALRGGRQARGRAGARRPRAERRQAAQPGGRQRDRAGRRGAGPQTDQRARGLRRSRRAGPQCPRSTPTTSCWPAPIGWPEPTRATPTSCTWLWDATARSSNTPTCGSSSPRTPARNAAAPSSSPRASRWATCSSSA